MAEARQVAAAFVQAFNAHDEDGIRRLNGEDTVFEAPGDVRVEGREASTQYAMTWLRAFPDAKLIVHNELAAGDWVVQEFTFEGTHEDTLLGPAGEIPATYRHLKGRGAQFLRVKDGEIVDTRLYFDQVQVMTQLGLLPDTAETTA